MSKRKRIFIYPLTKESMRTGGNDYVTQLIRSLSAHFDVCNRISSIGLLDAVLKFRKTDIYYFGWIEDAATKRFGLLQVVLLVGLLPCCKLSGKKVVHFIHNNLSHDKEKLRTKKFIARFMSRYADLVLSHSEQATPKLSNQELQVFHHPIQQNNGLTYTQPFEYDLLIWGKVNPYKGLTEFVTYASQNPAFRNYKILIAGKSKSDDHYRTINSIKSDNIVVLNQYITEEDLTAFFLRSRFVLFTYASDSVLSSAALCKSLSYVKEVIGPNIGSFKDLGERKLIYTYDSFPALAMLLTNLRENKQAKIDLADLRQYIASTSWSSFSRFVAASINDLYCGKKNIVQKTPKVEIVENEPI